MGSLSEEPAGNAQGGPDVADEVGGRRGVRAGGGAGGSAPHSRTINGGHHSPTFYSGSVASEFAPRVIDWLLAHPKP